MLIAQGGYTSSDGGSLVISLYALFSVSYLWIYGFLLGSVSGYFFKGDSIDPVIQLAITLRILAGGSYLDIAFGYNVGNSTVYPNFWKVMEAINK